MKNKKELRKYKGTVEELQQIIKEEYSVDITLEEAIEIKQDLVGYFSLLAELKHRLL